MSHECFDCGQTCYCDMEDHDQPMPDECSHCCPPEDDDFYDPGENESIEKDGYA